MPHSTVPPSALSEDIEPLGVDLSIVIVSYNTRTMTLECLASVFENSFSEHIEVLVVDNASTDGSPEAIEEHFPQVRLIRNRSNVGFAAANNQAFPLARGEFVLLLNSDTIVLDDVLAESVRYMRKNPHVGGMGCRVLNTDRSVQHTCSGFPTPLRLFMTGLGVDRVPGGLFDRYLLRHWRRDDERSVDVVTGCYLLTRQEVLRQVGYLDDSFFFFGEETDWCLRVRDAGWVTMFAPVGEIIHHGGGSVKKLNYKRDLMLTDAMVRLHRKHGGPVSGALTYLILLGFNISRYVFWSICALVDKQKNARATHFRQVVCASLDISMLKGSGPEALR